MMRKIIAGVCFFLLFAVNFLSADGKKAPNFSLKTVDEGKTVQLSDFKGKVVVVNFWGTRCPPCRAEIPDFVEIYNKYKDRGFEIIGIEVQSSPPAIKEMISKYKITYYIVKGDRKVASQYGGIRFIPTTFFIDRKGYIVKKHVGLLKKNAFEKILKGLLNN